METGKYIYCFIKEKEKLTLCGTTSGGSITPVYTLPCKDISSVVSDTGLFEYDPTRKYLLAHQRVITKVMEKYSPVPVAFGTVGNSEAEIRKITLANYDKLLEQLNFFQDKMELGLRVTWNDEAYIRDIEDKDIKKLKDKLSGKAEDDVLPDKIQLGRMVEAATLAKRDEYTEKIYEPLEKLAVSGKLKENIPIKTVFNAYFLIYKAKSDEFDKRVGELCKPYENMLSFSYTGPWPPYNFTDLKINFSPDIVG
jgi:hypothetical protein